MQPGNNQQQLIETAANMIAANRSVVEIEQTLMGMGATQQQAAEIISHLRNLQDDGKKAAGRRNMLIGGLWCVGGTIVTVVSYSAASGGGHYVITWGAIIFGLVQFFRGLVQTLG